ncbi:hypothetical protein QW060_02770 [Myroides ceti]|jgi:uncharacterized BrkB/YihY/UPF0761 family membrane protein|uniref:Uncharacterized protein n=1 Tax=Paenimyroides ceti TaxID=395087 RepID=A0ABT8CPC3_9FLAO|nr:hypothetical protein [Paenimyroides ceti]MDN3706050.1 hypothetical protein [Paenimyroides ceti]
MNKNILYFYGVLFATLLVSVIIYYQFNQKKTTDIENTFATPEEANAAVKKALQNVSAHINQGIISVKHLEEFEKTKNKISKK